MIKKTVSLALCMFTVCALLSGCGGEKTNSVPYTYGDGMKAYSPAVTISCAMPLDSTAVTLLRDMGYSADDNMWTQLYRDKLGIKLKADSSLSELNSYFEKLTAASMAGSLPDLILAGMGADAYSLIGKMYDRGQLADLSDAYDKLASDALKSAFASAGDEVFYPARFKGKIYALPQIIGSENEAYSFYYIRKDWLDNLGLQVPDSFESLLSVCEAFAVQDPDGNGAEDTYGLSFGGDFRDTASLFFAAYGAYPGQWVLEDGAPVYGSFTAETKTALAKLSEMYASGALNPDFTETTWADMYSAFNNGKCGVYMGKVYYSLLLEDLKKRNPEAEIVAVKAFSADGGIAQIMTPTNAGNYFCMSSECDYPEAAVKMFNVYLDTVNNVTAESYYDYVTAEDGRNIWSISPVRTGEAGANWKKACRVVEALEDGDSSELLPNEKVLFDQVKNYETSGDANLYGDWLLWKNGGTESTMRDYFEDGNLLPVVFNAAKTDSMQLYGDELYSSEVGGFSLIINGASPLDSFDTVAEAWRTGGGADISAEVADWYKNI